LSLNTMSSITKFLLRCSSYSPHIRFDHPVSYPLQYQHTAPTSSCSACRSLPLSPQFTIMKNILECDENRPKTLPCLRRFFLRRSLSRSWRRVIRLQFMTLVLTTECSNAIESLLLVLRRHRLFYDRNVRASVDFRSRVPQVWRQSRVLTWNR
jgi:hypothetical protein